MYVADMTVVSVFHLVLVGWARFGCAQAKSPSREENKRNRLALLEPVVYHLMTIYTVEFFTYLPLYADMCLQRLVNGLQLPSLNGPSLDDCLYDYPLVTTGEPWHYPQRLKPHGMILKRPSDVDTCFKYVFICLSLFLFFLVHNSFMSDSRRLVF